MITIYTDGSCANTGKTKGIGGWAAILRMDSPKGTHAKEISGHKNNSTSSEMELMAAYQALLALNDSALKHTVVVISDSEYVVKAFEMDGRAFRYERQGWSKLQGVQLSIPNVELIKAIHELSKKYAVVWRWVRGHNGDEYNERADKLANEARKELVDELRGCS